MTRSLRRAPRKPRSRGKDLPQSAPAFVMSTVLELRQSPTTNVHYEHECSMSYISITVPLMCSNSDAAMRPTTEHPDANNSEWVASRRPVVNCATRPIFPTGSAATAVSMGGPTFHMMWRARSGESSPRNTYVGDAGFSATTAARDTEISVRNSHNGSLAVPSEPLHYQFQSQTDRAGASTESITLDDNADADVPRLDRHLLAAIFRYIANELDSAVPDDNLRELVAAMSYLLQYTTS